MKKFLSWLGVCLCFLIVCSQIAVYATEDPDNTTTGDYDGVLFTNSDEDVKAKKEMELKYADNFVYLNKEQLEKRNEKIDSILNDTSISDEEKFSKLESMKVYRYIPKDNQATLASQPNGVKLNKPTITYDSKTKNWKITASGEWKSYSHLGKEIDNNKKIWYSVGDTWNVGGYDAVGISLSNTSGYATASKGKIKQNLLRVSGSATLSNGKSVKNKNSSTNDDKYGAIFKLQDYSYVTAAKLRWYLVWDYEYRYVGYKFSTTITYNKKFSEWDGTAKLYYAHTWNKTSISNISVSKTGVGIGWKSEGSGFYTYGLGKGF